MRPPTQEEIQEYLSKPRSEEEQRAWMDRLLGRPRVLRPTDAAEVATGGRPEPRLLRTPRDAETAARDWMIAWDHFDACLTREGADAGIDVDSSDAVAQVKAQTQPTGRPDVQRLSGVASVEGKAGYFFSIAGFTDEAQEWAERANIALFSFDLTGEPTPVNQVAEDALSRRVPDERALEYARDLLDDYNDTVASMEDLKLRN